MSGWSTVAAQVARRAMPMQVLRERGSDVLIARVAAGDRSVIVKLWNRNNAKGWLRRLTRTNAGAREWRTLRRLQAAGLRVPAPLAYLHLAAGEPYTEALVVEDLGACRDTTEEMKGHLRAGREAEFRRLEDQVIDATTRLVGAGLLDADHRLPNFVVTPDGNAVRLDFELVRRLPCPRLHRRAFGIMLGTLLGSHAFALQPDTRRTTDFAARLARATNASPAVLRVAKERADGMMHRQERETGIRTRVEWPW